MPPTGRSLLLGLLAALLPTAAQSGLELRSADAAKTAIHDALLKVGAAPAEVPMLEHNGRCVSQSLTIVRHAARLGCLYGATAEEATQIDEILDGIKDARGAVVAFPFNDAQDTCQRHAGAVAP